ncbi:MAG: hypothetical protein JXA97_08740 [Anaerolineales bacterium]|nr:hypothetical protein [Anaerolineales bacterium]
MSNAAALLQHEPAEGWLILGGSWHAVISHIDLLGDLLLPNEGLDLDLVSLIGDDPGEGLSQLCDELEDMIGILCRTVDLGEVVRDVISTSTAVRTIFILAARVDNKVVHLGELLRLLLQTDRPGTILIVAGQHAAEMGEWRASSDGGIPRKGSTLLSGAMIIPEESALEMMRSAEAFLKSDRKGYVLSLPAEALIAFGPDEQIRVAGDPPPKITFGSSWKEA